jgi:DNA-binding response OmpR family regulator
VKIMLVEDDTDTLDVTTYSLRKSGYDVVACTDGQQAVARWESEKPDLVVLDVNLPKVNGFDVCRKIRDNSLTPVIMLTGRTDEEHVLQGFNVGADDYVTKPFSHKQLAARIRAVLNRVGERVPAEPAGQVKTTDMVLDMQAHEVTRNGKNVRLTPLEFKILYILASNEGRVVSSQRLIEYAWGYDGGDPSLLKTHVCHIRQKLGFKDVGPNIESVPWVGYKLVKG